MSDVQLRKFWRFNWPSKVGASSLMFCKFIPSWSDWTLYLGVWFSSQTAFSLTFLVVSCSSQSKCSLLLLNFYSTLPNRVDMSSKSFATLPMLDSSQKLGLEGDIVFHYEWAFVKLCHKWWFSSNKQRKLTMKWGLNAT